MEKEAVAATSIAAGKATEKGKAKCELVPIAAAVCVHGSDGEPMRGLVVGRWRGDC